MSQNVYDDQDFFDEYAKFDRSIIGLGGAPEWPSLQKMLPELRGAIVADLGCGYGWFSRYVSSQGAARVVGVDISTRMLTKAKTMTRTTGITFIQSDLEALSLEENTYDLVYSSLAFHYIKDFHNLAQRIYKWTKPGGRLVFSVEHPIFTSTQNGDWVEFMGCKSWPVNSYHNERPVEQFWLNRNVIKYHRHLATYINMLVDQGFSINKVVEWCPSEEDLARDSRFFVEKERPLYMLLSAQKPSSA